jgi:hypothetical protein
MYIYNTSYYLITKNAPGGHKTLMYNTARLKFSSVPPENIEEVHSQHAAQSKKLNTCGASEIANTELSTE